MLAAGAIAALGTLGAAAPAMAAANPASNANADLYSGNAFCNGAQVKTQANDVGFANFHRSQDGTTVSVNYHLKNAAPNTTYTVWLYEGFCNFDATLGTVTTNDQGVGNANFTDVAVGNVADTSFFTYSAGGLQNAESAAVTLP